VAAFLQDIREHPADDAPRLILADWLDDFGDEADRARGELIRLQCGEAQPGRQRGARHREQHLLRAHAADWLGPLAALAEQWRCERGLLHVTLQGARCHSRTLLELAPTETYAWVEGLTFLQLAGGEVNALVQQPILRGVTSLTVAESRLGDAGVALLAGSPHLGDLRVLNLAHCSVRDGGPAALAASAALAGLGALDLTRNHVGAAGLVGLTRCDAFPRLRRLRLGHNNIPDEALRVLAGSRLLAGLEHLDLQGNRECGGAGLTALVDSPQAAGLRVLGLQHTLLHLATVQALAGTAHLDQLATLHLDDTHMGNDCLKALAFGAGLPRLHTLSLGRNNLTDAGVTALTLSPRPRAWRALELGRNHLGLESAAALADWPALAELEELGLEDNHIGDDGALALARSPHLRRLRVLDVGNNGLTAAGQAVLLRRFGRGVVVV
jgi:uncharacterized protein (TIGR02996 family)